MSDDLTLPLVNVCALILESLLDEKIETLRAHPSGQYGLPLVRLRAQRNVLAQLLERSLGSLNQASAIPVTDAAQPGLPPCSAPESGNGEIPWVQSEGICPSCDRRRHANASGVQRHRSRAR